MGWSESVQPCKTHPYHNQKQGVCPSCLRERLSQLYVTPPNKAIMVSHSISSASSYSAASSFNHMSPVHRRHQRNASGIMGSISFRLSVGGDGLKKSRSIAFVSRNHVGEVKKGKKKEGFWSKLLHLKGKKEVLMHSLAMKDRLH